MPAAFINSASNVPARISFNAGTLDFGNQRLVDVDSLSMSLEYANLRAKSCIDAIIYSRLLVLENAGSIFQ